MILERTSISCGAQLLYNLGRPEELAALLHHGSYLPWYARRSADGSNRKIYRGETVIFSDIKDRYGDALAEFIKENRLGRIVSLTTINPNTKNRITTYVWVYNGRKPGAKKRAPTKKATKGVK